MQLQDTNLTPSIGGFGLTRAASDWIVFQTRVKVSLLYDNVSS